MDTGSLPASEGRKQTKRKREKSGNPALDIRKRDRKPSVDEGASQRGQDPVQAASRSDDIEGISAPEAEEEVGKYVRIGRSRGDPLMESEGMFEVERAGEKQLGRDRHHSAKKKKDKGRKEKGNKEGPPEGEVGESEARRAERLQRRPVADERQSAEVPAGEVAHGASKATDPSDTAPLEKSAAAARFEKRTATKAGTPEPALGDEEEGPNGKVLKRRRNGNEKLERVQNEQPAAALKDLEKRSSARAGGVPAGGQQRSASKRGAEKGTAASRADTSAGPSGQTEKRKATGSSRKKVTASGSDALAAGKAAARERRKSAEGGKQTAETTDAPRRNPRRNAAEALRKVNERDKVEGRERTAKQAEEIAKSTGQAGRRGIGQTVERSEKDSDKEQGKRTGLHQEGAGAKEGLQTEKKTDAASEDENEDEGEEKENEDNSDQASDSGEEEDEENERSDENSEDEEGDDDAEEIDGDQDDDGALTGGEDEAKEEKKPKTRIFEVVHWTLRSMMKMSICTLIEGVGIWELQDSGAHLILAGQKLTAAGGQSSRLLQGSDVFHMNAPLSGTEEQMERDGRLEWQIRSKEQRDGIRGYLKTVDHVTKTAKWTDKLLGWDHVALAPLRKQVFGGMVILPGPGKQALVLDLRGNQPGAFQLLAGTKYERLAELQRIAMPAAEGEEVGEHHPRQDLAFVFEVKGAGKVFNVEDFATKLAVDRGAEPFREFLRRLGMNVEVQKFLLKWLALVLRREVVPTLIVQNSILCKLLLYTFIPPAAICTVKMHEALPANSPSALAYLAIKCNDVGPTLATTNPLCGLIEQREERASMFERGEVASPPPPLLLDCAPGHIPALAAGATGSAGKVRVVLSDLKPAEERQVFDDWENPSYRQALQVASVFAAVQGAVLLTRDGDRLLHESSPPLLSELGRSSSKVEKPLVKIQPDNSTTILQATLEGVEHAAVVAYDPDDRKGVDFRMLCVVALLRSAPKKWKGVARGMDGCEEAFEKAASEAAKLGRPNITRERMFQAGQRGSNVLKRVEALGSCSVFDAIGGPKKKPEASGGSRVLGLQILGDDLTSIFSQQILGRYPTCRIGACKDSNSAQHLRELCILKERLARRKLSRESPLAFLLELKDSLEAQHVEEFPEAEFVPRGEDERQDAEALEQYVQRLSRQMLKMRKEAADEAAIAAAAAADVGDAT